MLKITVDGLLRLGRGKYEEHYFFIEVEGENVFTCIIDFTW